MPKKKTGTEKTARRGMGQAGVSPLPQLRTYRRKRDFGRTPEPRGQDPRRGRSSLVYVIQRHRASHLHFDLRLQEGQVLKSWAIPKSPPERIGERRLAVETEDHPLDYASFEGTIPEGEYGAGVVDIWDRGTYRPLDTAPAKRIIDIRGKKLSGIFALVKLRPREGEKDRNWLFFKTRPDGLPRRRRKAP